MELFAQPMDMRTVLTATNGRVQAASLVLLLRPGYRSDMNCRLKDLSTSDIIYTRLPSCLSRMHWKIEWMVTDVPIVAL